MIKLVSPRLIWGKFQGAVNQEGNFFTLAHLTEDVSKVYAILFYFNSLYLVELASVFFWYALDSISIISYKRCLYIYKEFTENSSISVSLPVQEVLFSSLCGYF